MNWIKTLFGAPFEIAGRAYDSYLNHQTREAELEDAKHARRVEVIKAGRVNEAIWNQKHIENAGWRDEWITVLLSTPLVLVFFPWFVDDIRAGFAVLETLPDWYKAGVGVMIGSAFGYQKYTDLVMRKAYALPEVREELWAALLDSDIIAYQVAFRAEETFDFGTTQSKHVDTAEAIRLCDRVIAEQVEAVDGDLAVICLTDPDAEYRKELEPTYKGNRQIARRPELLMTAKQYMFEEYRSYIRPRLEADDIMGILATRPSLLGKSITDTVIVSADKDMRTIPAKVYNPNHPEVGILEITPTEAKQFHMWQTIVGDPTDGYGGVPGVGPKSPYALDAMELTDPLEMWDNVLEAYASKGLTEDHAIHQARLARILWADNYNFKKKTVRLWNPTKLFW